MSTHIDCLGHVIIDVTPRIEITFVTAEDTWTPLFDDYLFSLGVEPVEPEYYGCECEIDWNCPLHANRRGTWLETRYEDDYDDEQAARYDVWENAS